MKLWELIIDVVFNAIATVMCFLAAVYALVIGEVFTAAVIFTLVTIAYNTSFRPTK